MRQLATRLTTLIVILLLVIGCTSPPPVTPMPRITPTPTSERGDAPIPGKQGPKRGDMTPVPDAPKKDGEDKLPPINEAGGSKPNPDDVKPVPPGQFDKPDPERLQVEPGQGAKQPRDLALPREPYIRAQFDIEKTKITLRMVQELPGPLVPTNAIDGEWLYVATVEQKPVAVGSFRDPLLAVALPFERGQGYLPLEQATGQFAISLPGELLQFEMLRAAVITIYRLDPTIPFDTPLTVETVDGLVKRSEPIGRVFGSDLYELYQKTR